MLFVSMPSCARCMHTQAREYTNIRYFLAPSDRWYHSVERKKSIAIDSCLRENHFIWSVKVVICVDVSCFVEYETNKCVACSVCYFDMCMSRAMHNEYSWHWLNSHIQNLCFLRAVFFLLVRSSAHCQRHRKPSINVELYMVMDGNIFWMK